MTAIIVGMIAAVSVGRHPVSSTKFPDPNGYLDLARAGSLVEGIWPGHGNLRKAELPEIRAFLASHKAALGLARIGLARECLAPFEDSNEGLERHIQDVNAIFQVGQLLRAEAWVAEADGRIVDASKACLDWLALGLAMTRGGIGSDLQMGTNQQWQAILAIRKLRDRLPAGEIPGILRALEAADASRVSVEAVEARWLRFYENAHNPYLKFVFRLNGMDKTGRANERKMAQGGRDRVDRALRFLLAELAIHAYHADKTAWPRSLGDLAPTYLKAVPVDPTTNRPIDYPTNESGELTDNLEAIGRPDGEVKPRP